VEARVFSLKEGQISEPVQSRFGFHIFKVDKIGTAPLAQVSNNITRHVKQENTFTRVEVLRKSAKVEFDPKFFPEAKNWGTRPAAPATKRPS
jgi:parvulin-like peptidyl-prolyl isomerase